MRGSVNPQQAVELLKQQRPKEKSMSPRSNIKPQISPKQKKRSDG
jgi:hypothetical protein